jgi:hypothetical protein
MTKRELHLEKCIEPWLALKSPRIDGLKSGVVVPPAKAYERNLRRVYALTVFPPVCVTAVATTERITYEKKLEYRRQLSTHKIGAAKFREIVLDAFTEHEDNRRAILSAGGDQAQKLQQTEIAHGFGILDSVLVSSLIDGADAWLSAQISGIWTAFEALAEEVWIAALNAQPHSLAELKGIKKSSSNDDKKIDLHVLQRYGYDLSKNMGTILSKKFSFDKLEDIRRAYAEAGFHDDELPIQEIFAEKSLDVLALTRHVIMHNGGLVDDAFLRRRADLPPELLIAISEPLPLSGEIVAALIAPVMQLGWDLIVAVDQWLLKNGEAAGT